MFNYKYLIIGSGMTADAAVRGIRSIDQQGTIGMIGEESDPPYNRPPLSTPPATRWSMTTGRHIKVKRSSWPPAGLRAACLSVAKTSCISEH